MARIQHGARLALEDAVGRDPLNAGLLISLGRQQLITLAADAAETSFRRALELEPSNADAFLGLADVLEHLRPEELPQLTALSPSASTFPLPMPKRFRPPDYLDLQIPQ